MESKEFENIRAFGSAINGLTDSFNSLANVKAEGFTTNLGKMLRGIGAVLSAKDALINGGTWAGQSWGLSDNISFGEKDKGGLKNLSPDQLEIIKTGVTKLYTAMGVSTPAVTISSPTESLRLSGGVGIPSNLADTISGKLKDLYVETLTVRQGLSTPAVNIVDASTRTGATTVNNTSTVAGSQRTPPARNTTNYDFFVGPR